MRLKIIENEYCVFPVSRSTDEYYMQACEPKLNIKLWFWSIVMTMHQNSYQGKGALIRSSLYRYLTHSLSDSL